MAHSDLYVYELWLLMHCPTLDAPYGSLRLECILAVHANAQSYTGRALWLIQTLKQEYFLSLLLDRRQWLPAPLSGFSTVADGRPLTSGQATMTWSYTFKI